MVGTLWSALGGDAGSLARLRIVHDGPWLGGTLAVDDLAVGAVATALLAACELAQARGASAPEVELSGEHVALSFHSERHALLDGRPVGGAFAPLSRFVRCAGDGWARTHGNYSHHASALVRALRIDAASDGEEAVAALESAAATFDAVELEQAVVAAGGCAAAVRTPAQWRSHAAGRALAAQPLVGFGNSSAPIPPARPGRPSPPAVADRATQLTRLGRPSPPALVDPASPAAGVRVLDLTRVIAGPVAGRTLAALGAEVLRVDPPGLPEIAAQHLDADPGKRTALLDLADERRREALLAGADVVLIGYRPGALARFGMRPDQLAERHPHLVQVWLSAWGSHGPWAQRRGFDSLVQAAAGIAALCADRVGRPGALPAQALDHATGHLMAASALLGLARRAREQPCPPFTLSLARTAAELVDAPRSRHTASELTGRPDPARHRVDFGRVSLIAPPGRLDGTPLRWAHGPRPFGCDPPAWSAPAPAG